MLGISITVWIFLLALIRTPASIFKMMYLTATTTEEVFTNRCLDPPLRITVFILAPIPRLLFVAGLTVYSLVFGTMNYIGQLTAMMFNNDWKSSVLYDGYCPIGSEYIKVSQDESDDDHYFMAMKGLKCYCALVPGMLLGVLPFIPFSIAALLITLYRLPINVYKTMKLALFTVVLKWDLKIAALLILPISHAIFPLVAFTTSLVGSYFYFVYSTTKNIVESQSPFNEWGEFRVGLTKYYEAHQQFVGENQLGRYDHPTGIPSGWQGEIYGIPIQKILKWQWDFLVCCFLLLISMLVCFTGSLLIFTLKFIPSIITLWKSVCTNATIECWPCILMAFLLTPFGVFVFSLLSIAAGTAMSFWVPATYLENGYRSGFRFPLEVLGDIDRWDCFHNGLVLQCLPEREEERLPERSIENRQSAEGSVDAYWDRFASQCIRSTSCLLSKGWISLDDVQSMEPSVISAIPTVAILDILSETVNDIEAHNDEDILWKIDGTLCRKEDRPRHDIAALLWPKVIRIKRLLDRKVENKKVFAETRNLQVLQAMICNNADDVSFDLKAFVEDSKIDDEDTPNSSISKEIRSKLIELTLVILRVKPFQDRMKSIFGHKYDTDHC